MQPKKANPFKLRDFRGVDPLHLAALEAVGIKNTYQMLSAGKTVWDRQELSEETNLPLEAVVELVKLSDLARLPGVKGIRARLYLAAGADTVEKLASFEPQVLLDLTAEFVAKSGFEGIPPLPKEVSSTIANARNLPRVVDW